MSSALSVLALGAWAWTAFIVEHALFLLTLRTALVLSLILNLKNLPLMWHVRGI